jgi:hypothetical protein
MQDSVPLSPVEHKRGYEALLQNPFYNDLVAALNLEAEQRVNLIIDPVLSIEGFFTREQAIGELRAYRDAVSRIPKIITVLAEQIKLEQEKHETNPTNTDSH